MPFISTGWRFDQDGDITIHIPYMVDNPPYDAVNNPQAPTASIYARPEILGYSPQFNIGGSSQFLALPVPKISLSSRSDYNNWITISSVDMCSPELGLSLPSGPPFYGTPISGTPGATVSILYSHPIYTGMDLTDYHFESASKPIFLEMMHYSKKKRSKRDGYNKSRGGWKVSPSHYVIHNGPDPSLPWGTNFWTRGGSASFYNGLVNGQTYTYPVDRPNHFQIVSPTQSRIDIYKYLMRQKKKI